MTSFFSWYILITLLGWITFPLAYHLFPALADRGYTLSRTFGLLVWAFIFWLFASLGIAQNDLGGLLLGLIVVGGASAYLTVNRKSEIQNWLGENCGLIITAELLFLVTFGFMAFVRASNPEITTAGGEKWMEVAFINAILRSPVFPPHDPWLSGYAISYYYFGYVMTAMLAKFTSVPASIAHNLMLSLVFALSAIGAYGILYNLLKTIDHGPKTDDDNHRPWSVVHGLPLLAPLFLLLISNVEGFLETLHRLGLFWKDGPNFWKWLDIPDLREAPSQVLGLAPDRFYWWWRASRVVQDYDLNGTFREAIDEFPAFSFVLGDLHPHVLAMPFVLLAISVALNIFLGGWSGNINLYFGQLKINKQGLVVSALVLGGLAFLNTWDVLFIGVLMVLSYAMARVRESGWSWERLEDVLLFGIPLGITAFVLYIPFFISFDSQASGIVPNFMYPTRGAHLWVMWGTLFVPLFAFLIYLWGTKAPVNWRAGVLTSLGVLLALFTVLFTVGFLATRFTPDIVKYVLDEQQLNIGTLISKSMERRLSYVGSLLTLMALLTMALSFLFSNRQQEPVDYESQPTQIDSPASSFVLLMIVIGVLLILGIDFVYLRDGFGYRINSVFKFYFQAWELLSLAAAFGVSVMFLKLPKWPLAVYTLVMVLVIVVGLAFPVFAFPTRTDDFKVEHPEQRTLDGSTYLANVMPDDYQAIQFMKGLEFGVIAEAVGGQYSEYARMATFTGMPTVLGWPGHEGQWRDGSLQGSRNQDIETLYVTPDWSVTQEIIKRYNIRYIVVGNLERTSYRVNEEKFNNFLKPVFQQGSITIYEVP
ncbi:MAG: hypothetical protein IPP66_04525 [Anaerolineales bacterium]|nr:hypothetical protein [Anaerolineales bacterium]